jgi:signal transduction histidine kinase
VLLGAALVTVGWFDYASTRREFGALVRAQAASARDTVAAAARANRAAAAEARDQLAERLLDNARLLAEVDRRGGLTAASLEDIAARNHLFRITVLRPDASRELFVAPDRAGHAGQGGGFGPGPGGGLGMGPGGGFGMGAGGGPGAGMAGGAVVERLLSGEREAVTDLHEGRRAGAARLAGGVRRHDGGAIVLIADATEVARLQRQSSLDALLADIVANTEDVAYIVFEHGGVRKVQGEAPEQGGAVVAGSDLHERRLEVRGRPVLELTGPIDLGTAEPAHLRLGMRLDRLRSAEQRTAVRLAISLASAAALGVLAIGFAWIRRRFGALSAEHALAQEALRRRDRLSAMGELASTVAHEIRNPLNAIAMSAQRLKGECLDLVSAGAGNDAADARELVDVIRHETHRLNSKVQQFLEFARPPALNRHPTPMGPWLEAIVSAARPLAESRGIAIAAEPGQGTALFDAEQMRQAVDNLLRNALDATPHGGRITIAAAASTREWSVEVRDTGTGIAAEHLPRVFDLYFTTKPTGTGVGLALTQQIVAAHGGTIEVDSPPGRGTAMRIHVPVRGEIAHA